MRRRPGFAEIVSRRLRGACLSLLLLAALVPAWPQSRVALVIGNSAYAQKPLPNPANDAADLAASLKRLGFDVTLQTNRNADQLRSDLARFQDKLSQGSVGVFYFAGHGVQAGRPTQNYLLPVGQEYKRERDAELYGLEVGIVLRRMEESGASLSVVILDACRDSPLPAEGRSTAGRGLGRMEAPSGSLIAFATAPGSIADENTAGRNGLYTKHLLAAIETPGLRIEDVFKRVRRAVEKDSNRRQSPEEISKLTNETPFYFKAEAGAPVASARPEPAVQAPRSEPTRSAAPTSIAPGQIVKDCDVCPELVVVAAGSFEMGSNDGNADEKPPHPVSVASFLLGKTEVTQGQWKALMGSNPSEFSQCGDDCPVENVSWEDAQAYVKKLSERTGKRYRLPSEAEWEYAARAGTKTKYWWGDTASHDYANYGKDECCEGLARGRDRWVNTAPVAQFPTNAFGLYDLHGNVWEWVQDVWHDNYTGAPTDGTAWMAGGDPARRVLRGGSWISDPGILRSAIRSGGAPVGRDIGTGLRIARTF